MNIIQLVVGLGLLVFFYFAARKIFAREVGENERDVDPSAGRKTVCPECGYDIRVTPDHCPECDARPLERRDYFRRLRTCFPADQIEMRRPSVDEDVVLVLTTREWNEAKLIIDQLKARGVPASIKHEKSPLEYGETIARRDYHVLAYSGDAEIIQAFLDYAHGVEKNGPPITSNAIIPDQTDRTRLDPG